MSVPLGYLSLCYHYVRPEKEKDLFPRIIGHTEKVMHSHMEMLKNNFSLMGLAEAEAFSYNPSYQNGDRYGMLVTFDDGLSDHFIGARILFEHNIKGIFFIPGCVLMDKLPANPTIIHYSIAHFGLAGFLNAYRSALEDSGIEVASNDIQFVPGKDNPWDTIAHIKKTFKYSFHYSVARKILLHIYENLLLGNFPDMLEIMHLTSEQIKQMLDMGHAIGVHSRTHISVAASSLSEEDFRKEIVEPRHFFEKTFGVPVTAFSYPFGGEKDCLPSHALISKTNEYQLAFTVEKIVNKKLTSPFELGRYMPRSTESATDLQERIADIIRQS